MRINCFVEFNDEKKVSKSISQENVVMINVKEEVNASVRKYYIELINKGDKNIYIKKAGIIFEGIEKKEIRSWRIFSDLGACGWAGVKCLDYLQKDERMGVIQEQRTCNGEDGALPFHRSDLQSVIWDAENSEAILFGFLRQTRGINKIDVIPESDCINIEYIEAWQNIGCYLKKGSSINLDPLVVICGSNPYILLESFAEKVAENHGKSFNEPPVVGMMTWYGYRTAITEEIVLENAEIVANMFNGYPQEMKNIMLIDHGWQDDANWGYFAYDKQRFPHGLKWLGNKLKKYNINLALWHTPFCISPNAKNHEELNHLMAKGVDGEARKGTACVWGDLPGHKAGNWDINFFDGSKAEVQERWCKEMKQLKEWGVVYCKMDFFALQASQNKEKKINTGDLYKQSWESFRKGAGEDMHIAPCSCATNMQLGYCDSIRIGSDIGNSGHWPGAYSFFRYGLSTIAALWYKNRKFWVNDADSIQIAKGCSLAEARVRATVVALSGGHLMLSEDLRMVDSQRLEIIRRILPAYPHAAKPLNLFENPFPEGYPSLWSLSLNTGFGQMTVLAIFNMTTNTATYQITPEMLDIPQGPDFIAIEWWQSKWLGKFNDKFCIDVPAEDVAIIHAQPIKRVPSLVTVSHHITGGYIIENVEFEEMTGILSGDLVTKAGIPMVIFGYCSGCWKLDRTESGHAVSNSLGGWQKEVVTSGQRTRFSVKFCKII